MVNGDSKPGLKRTRPWHAERPGAAAVRQSAVDELFTLVAFDVPCDKARRKLGELCKDYGLKRTQWSVFEGPMTRNRREELSARLTSLLENAEGGGRAAVFPIGKQEAGWALRVATRGVPVKDASTARSARVKQDEEDLAALLGGTIAGAEAHAKAGGGHE